MGERVPSMFARLRRASGRGSPAHRGRARRREFPCSSDEPERATIVVCEDDEATLDLLCSPSTLPAPPSVEDHAACGLDRLVARRRALGIRACADAVLDRYDDAPIRTHILTLAEKRTSECLRAEECYELAGSAASGGA
jgi:hypothetical protein